jgi:hypothetical protein
VFQRLGPMPPQDKQAKSSRRENFEEEEDKYQRSRWCPDGLSHSKKMQGTTAIHSGGSLPSVSLHVINFRYTCE